MIYNIKSEVSKMKKKLTFIIILGTLILSSCGENPLPSLSEDSSTSESSSSATDVSSSEFNSSSEEIPPLVDPDIPNLTRSKVWPSEAINEYLTFAKNIKMPVFNNIADFHHGIYYNEYELDFYRVYTRLSSKAEFEAYLTILQDEYFFTVTLEEGLYYAESEYDDVRIYLEYTKLKDGHAVSFDFFNGSGDNYKGLVAVDGVAKFNLRTKEALTSISASKGKWEVRPAKFTVYKRNAPFAVGNINNEHIVDPLRIYAGQEAYFTVQEQYYIEKIVIIVSPSYADETLAPNAEWTNGTASADGDYVTVMPTKTTSQIEFFIPQLMDHSQVRWLGINIHFARR